MIQSPQTKNFPSGMITSLDCFDILENAPTALVIVSMDTDLQVAYVTPEFTRLFGYARSDMITVKDWAELAYPDADWREQEFTSWYAEVQQAQADHSPIPPRQVPVRCKDGTFPR